MGGIRIKRQRSAFGRPLFNAGLAACLVLAALLLWGIFFPSGLLDLVQAWDFTLR